MTFDDLVWELRDAVAEAAISGPSKDTKTAHEAVVACYENLRKAVEDAKARCLEALFSDIRENTRAALEILKAALAKTKP